MQLSNGSRLMRKQALSPRAEAAAAITAMRMRVELWMLGILLNGYWLFYIFDAIEFYPFMNVFGPIALMGILGGSCYRIVSRSAIAVWAPLFWFRLACSVYFGFGALVPHIVNEETRFHIHRLFYFDDEINLKVNLLYCFGIFIVLLFSYVFLRVKRSNLSEKDFINVRQSASQLLIFALSFLIVGGVLRYGIVLPYTFGLTQTVLPGIFATLSRMYYAGIYLLIVYALLYNKNILIVAASLFLLEIAVTVASFAKTELMLLLIFTFLGFLNSGISKTKLLVGAVCIMMSFFTFQSLVSYGRDQIALRYGKIHGADLAERLEIVQNYLQGEGQIASSRRQSAQARLSYVNVNAYVIDRYDSGVPGDTLGNALAIIIPRVLWPDKPIVTSLGSQLNYMIFRSNTSSLGVGHFGEAYWNFGWFGTVPMMGVLALILSIFTRFSMKIMARKDWLLLPVVFLGVNVGLRVDGYFVPGILGPAWTAVCLGIGLVLFRSFFETLFVRKIPYSQNTAWSRGT